MRPRSFLRPAIIAPVVCLLYSAGLVVLAGDPFILLTLGERFAPADLSGHLYSTSGYDGQFTYYLARYGLDSEPYLDVPAYRAQRILLPFAARLLARGDPLGTIWALLFLNATGVALGTLCLERLLHRRHASPWLALTVALSLGMFGSVRMTTTEPLALGLALAGLDFADGQHWWRAGITFALAGLAREMMLLFPTSCALLLISRDRREVRSWAAVLGCPALTYAAWQVVLYETYGAPGLGSGGADATGFEPIPFWGLAGPLVELLRRGDVLRAAVVGVLMGGFVVLPTVWALIQSTARRPLRLPQGLAEWLLLVHALLILFVPASTFTEPLGMFRFIAGLQIATILFAAEQQFRRTLDYSWFWVCTTVVLVTADLHTVFD